MSSSKKVSIVTLNLSNNYGGILQAYALQKALLPYYENIQTVTYRKKGSTLFIALGYIKRLVYRLILKSGNVSTISPRLEKRLSSELKGFVKRNVKTSTTSKVVDSDAIIVGSDQVWRAPYVNLRKYFLEDFKSNPIKISYAASFGRDDLEEYTNKDIQKVKTLVKRFDAVSVRESSGVDIVKSTFKLQAAHHIDPTLLIDRSYYDQLADIANDDIAITDKIHAYILDTSDSKTRILHKISQYLQATPSLVLPEKPSTSGEFLANPSKYQMPPVEQWLRSFRDAKYIVTDSFHGTVFSIIFNKPFIAIGNKERGLARFTSLLEMFGLEDRLVTSIEEVTDELIDRPIDWDSVNEKIKAEQKRSLDYLKKHLG